MKKEQPYAKKNYKIFQLQKYSKILDKTNILIDNIITKEGTNVKVKIRYKAKEANATAYLYGDKIKIIFDEPQFAIAPGQSCVIYIDDVVIAGGIISK